MTTEAQIQALHKAIHVMAGISLSNDALKYIAEAYERAAWQSMDSAPKDGTEILLEGTIGNMLVPKPVLSVAHYSRGWWNNSHPSAVISHAVKWRHITPPQEASNE